MARPKGSTKRKAINKKIGLANTKFTAEVIRKLEQAFSLDCSIDEACFYAGIGVSTYYDNIKLKPGLSERFEALRNKPVLMARQTIVKSVESNPDMALKYLERKRRKEFGLRIETENTTKLEVSADLSQLSDEDLKDIAAKLLKIKSKK